MRRHRFSRRAAFVLAATFCVGPASARGQVTVDWLRPGEFSGETSRLALLEAKAALVEAREAVDVALLEVGLALAALDARTSAANGASISARAPDVGPPVVTWHGPWQWLHDDESAERKDGRSAEVLVEEATRAVAVPAEASAEPVGLADEATVTVEGSSAAEVAQDFDSIAIEEALRVSQLAGQAACPEDSVSVVETLGELQESFLGTSPVLSAETNPGRDESDDELPFDPAIFLPLDSRHVLDNPSSP